MKKLFSLIVLATFLRCSLIVHAQGTLYDSNLGGYISTVAADSSDWSAQGFETGSTIAGYVLDSIQVQMAAANGNPSGFTLSLFSALNGLPFQSLGVLSGSVNPANAGVYSYDASALNLTLATSTPYFLVESATSPSSQGSYEWDITRGSANGLYGWQNLPPEFTSDSGSDWNQGVRTMFDMAIYATAVPEPPQWALLLFSGAALVLNRRWVYSR
jgi:hypothetical protein